MREILTLNKQILSLYVVIKKLEKSPDKSAEYKLLSEQWLRTAKEARRKAKQILSITKKQFKNRPNA